MISPNDQLWFEFVEQQAVDKGNGLIEIVQLRLFRWLRMSLTISSGVATLGTHGPQLVLLAYWTNGSYIARFIHVLNILSLL